MRIIRLDAIYQCDLQYQESASVFRRITVLHIWVYLCWWKWSREQNATLIEGHASWEFVFFHPIRIRKPQTFNINNSAQESTVGLWLALEMQ